MSTETDDAVTLKNAREALLEAQTELADAERRRARTTFKEEVTRRC